MAVSGPYLQADPLRRVQASWVDSLLDVFSQATIGATDAWCAVTSARTAEVDTC